MERNPVKVWKSARSALKSARSHCSPPPPSNDDELIAVAYEEGDYAEESVWAIFQNAQGFIVYIAKCDTTGWDCQNNASLEKYELHEHAVAAIDDAARSALVWKDTLLQMALDAVK